LKILLEKIPSHGIRLSLDKDSWFPHKELTLCGPLSAEVEVNKLKKRVFLSGDLKAEISCICDRCLDAYVYFLYSKFKVEFKVGQIAEEHVTDYLCQPEDLDVIFLKEPEIDVFSVLEQQVMLAVSGKSLCIDNCKGLCRQCGVNLNTDSCTCLPLKKESPFNVLLKLKKSK
jgi:uncharacterized protein